MVRKFAGHSSIMLSGLMVISVILSFSGPGTAGSENTKAFYSSDHSQLFWFIHTSDTHIGASGTQDGNNLRWLVTTAKTVINPTFTIVTGDLTDSTNGNWLGYPNGPYQTEWNEYKSIVDPYVGVNSYYDVPGNHDAYNDSTFSYYRANSVQGRASSGTNTQVSFLKYLGPRKYHFLGINTAGNDGAPFSLFPPYGDHAGLDNAELDFIASEMQANRDAQLTLLFGHHPLFDTHSADDTWVSYGLEAFLSLMDEYFGFLYGYGHTHDASEGFFVPASHAYPGFYYFNVASLGKSTSNQYTLMAIDGNALSSKIRTIGAWPAVLITAPVDAALSGANPYSYAVPASATNFVRALVFDPNSLSSVQFQVDQQTPVAMTQVRGNVWQGPWDASGLTPGTLHALNVSAVSTSGTSSSDTIAVRMQETVPTLKAGATVAVGKFRSGIFTPTSTFSRGNTIVFRVTVKDSNGSPVSGARVTLQVSGPATPQMASGATNASGQADVSWTTSRKSTPVGGYTVSVEQVISSYTWDEIKNSAGFTIK